MAQTIEQFGQTIKAKYPQYKDMSDADLGQRMLAKYPQYKDMVSTEPAKPEQGFGTKLAAGILKTPARVATSAINTAQMITGNKPTTPFSGDFLGSVQPLGFSETGEKLPLFQAAKDIGGGALEIGSYFVGGPALKGGVQALKGGELLAKPALSAFYQAGKAAAPAFAMQSAGSSLQDPTKGIGQNIADTAIGYGTGFGLGGTLGLGGKALEKTGVLNKIFTGTERQLKVADAAAKKLEQAAKIPKITPEKAADEALTIFREPIEAVEKKAISEGGTRIDTTSEGLFRSAKIAPSAREVAGQEALAPLIQEGKLRAKMSPSIQQKVIKERVSQLNQGVKDLTKRYNEPFNTGELMNRLNDAKASNRILFGNDKAAIDAYDTVIDEYLKYIKKNNVSGLLDSRQTFDQYIRNNFPKAFKEDILTGAVNPRYQALLDVRGVANNFAADLLARATKGDAAAEAFLNGLRNEHLLLNASDHIGLKMKGFATKGGKIPRFIENPRAQGIRKVAGAAALGLGGYAGVKSLFGD